MLIDSHIHVGQYYDQYHSPAEIARLADGVGIDYLAVSSTTMCEENYEKVLAEIQELVRLLGDRVLPVIWITPYGLEGSIAWFLKSDIKWSCLKVHPFLHKNDWDPAGSQFAEVVDIARELKFPLMIHTGVDECCRSAKYMSLISSNPDITFILAHGQPQEDALMVLNNCDNAFVDSAFMCLQQMVEIVAAGFANRLLWGTDMMIPSRFSHNQDMPSYYKSKLKSFKHIVSEKDFEQVTFRNATRVFKIPDRTINN